jgi:hypothetical protein
MFAMIKTRTRRAPVRLLTIVCLSSFGTITVGASASAGSPLATRAAQSSETPPLPHTATTSGGWTATKAVPVPVVPNGSFAAVSCAALSACEAVGSTFNNTPFGDEAGTGVSLAESFNGTAWKEQATVNPKGNGGASLTAVSCSEAASCQAVGDYLNDSFETFPYAEAWNGSTWKLESLPASLSEATFSGLSCPTASDCEAVGTAIVKWNGSTWAVQSPAKPSGSSGLRFSAVSCKAANACEAVGSYDNASFEQFLLAEDWNGTAWKVQSIAAPSGSSNPDLYGLSCAAATACEATGSYLNNSDAQVAFAERLNGTAWTTQSVASPSGASDPYLLGASCTAANSCEAVGEYTDGSKGSAPWAENWDGTTWTQQTAPGVAGTTSPELLGVSCTSSAACEAVGSYARGDLSASSSLGEVLKGKTWSIQATADPGASWGAQMHAVSCGGSSACEAVGIYYTSPELGDGGSAAYAEGWNGTRWALQSLPGSVADLSAVACVSPDSCEAVGSTALSWNGKSWAAQALAKPPGAMTQTLDAVACATADICEAVGDLTTGDGDSEPLAEGWNGSAWSLQTTPSPSGATNGSLAGVSCISTTACEAVGKDTAGSGDTVALTEAWKSPAWSLQTSADVAGSNSDELSAVSCNSDGACEAVGNYILPTSALSLPLAEALSSATWTLQPLPIPPSASGTLSLSGVSCLSTSDCETVGTMTYVWNGTVWQIQSGSTTALVAVSCPTADSCQAVGTINGEDGAFTPFVEGWSGPAWSAQTGAGPDATATTGDGLLGVSCVSASACESVGETSTADGSVPSAESWNGSVWKQQSMPKPPTDIFVLTDSVSCAAANACEAVGEFNSTSGNTGSFAAGWNGSTWSLQTIGAAPTEGSQPLLEGVACTGTESCEAVGSYTLEGFEDEPLAEVWNGTSWTAQTTFFVPDASNTFLSSLSCSASTCEAVGYYTDESGGLVFLAAVWNGATWTQQSTPATVATNGFVPLEVSCAAANACQAVGYISESTSAPETVSWNGVSWQVHSVSVPKGASQTHLFDVSCGAADSCLGVGQYENSAEAVFSLAEKWNGSAWSIQSTPASTESFLSVSCIAQSCEAVGYGENVLAVGVATADVWNGSVWAAQPSASPPIASDISLKGVSCTAVNDCEAVGSYTDSLQGVLPLAELWNGTVWTVQSVPLPTGASSVVLTSVSCVSASSCEAVGSYRNSSKVTVALAEVWKGASWKTQASPGLAGETDISLSSVRCFTANTCEAVGSSVNSKAVEVALAEAWDGTAWKVQTVGEPSGATGAWLSGVSCSSATSCEAVGSYLTASKVQSSLGEALHGTAWKPQSVPGVAGAKSSSLSGVSCAKSTCQAVGSYVNSSKVQAPLAEAWNGTAWKLDIVPAPAGVTASSLSAVDCASASSCEAVGTSTTSSVPSSVAMLWNGTAWVIQPVPAPSGATRTSLGGLACTAVRNCEAVGSSTSSPAGQVALVEVDN